MLTVRSNHLLNTGFEFPFQGFHRDQKVIQLVSIKARF